MNNSKLVYGIGLIALSLAVFFLASKARNTKGFKFGNTHWGKPRASVSDSLSIAGIRRLDADGHCDIILIPSDEERVVFYYDKEEESNISTVKDSVLHIEFETEGARFFGIGNSNSIMVKIYTRSIHHIVQQGVGSIKAEGTLSAEDFTLRNEGVGSMDFDIQAHRLSITNEGVGSISVKGSADDAAMTNGGTGSIDADLLTVKNAIVNNQGVGSVSLQASETLEMTNQGVGSIDYTGNAKVLRSVSQGIGSINKN